MEETPENDETHAPKRSRMRWLVIGLWVFVCGWLVLSLIVGLVNSLFYGDGPVTSEATTNVPAASQGIANASAKE